MVLGYNRINPIRLIGDEGCCFCHVSFFLLYFDSQVKMNAAAAQQHAGHFLPQITTNRNKRRQSSQCRYSTNAVLKIKVLSKKHRQKLT